MTTAQLIDMLTNLPQMIIMGYYIGGFVQVRHRYRFLAVFTAAIALEYGTLFFNSTLQTVFLWVIGFGLPLIFGKISKPKIILYLLISMLIMNLFSVPMNLLLARLYPDVQVLSDAPVHAIVMFKLLSFPLLVLSWYLSSRLCGRLLHVDSGTFQLRYLPFLLVETFAIVLLQLNEIFRNENMTLLLLCDCSVFVAMLVIDLLLARTIRRLNQANGIELEFQQAQDLLRSQSQNYAMFQSQLLSLHAIRHDTANQLGTISYLLEKGDYDSALQQLTAFRHASAQLASGHYTGNTTIDAVINVKLTGLDPACVGFQCEGSLPSELRLDPAALCSVMSNLLENAIHACQSLTSSSSVVILLKAGIRQNYLVLRCTNPCSPDTMIPDPENTHHDPKDLHGWGLQILRQIAAQHNGSTAFRLENGQFIAEIQLGLDDSISETIQENHGTGNSSRSLQEGSHHAE